MRTLSHARAAAIGLGACVLGWATAIPAGSVPPAAGGLCEALVAPGFGGDAYLAVFSAFPAELAPLVARTTVHEQIEIDGRPFYLGELEGVRVILGLVGIGMLNAAATTESVIAHLPVVGIVFSGVAGSPHRIGDVTVPLRFLERPTGSTFKANPFLYEVARGLRGHRVTLEQCTLVPPHTGETVCMEHEPAIFIGGTGVTDDPYGDTPAPCVPGGGDVIGCELPEPAAVTAGVQRAKKDDDAPVAEDMETASVARVATAHDVPWVAFRAVSDGAGDPLDLPGFPAQFFAYYVISADNAAAGAIALTGRIAELANAKLCNALARARWKKAARLARGRR